MKNGSAVLIGGFGGGILRAALGLVVGILADLEREGFCRVEGDRWLSV